MHRDVLFAFLAALFLNLFVVPAFADNRVALVVGNGAYSRAPHLLNPVHDAEDVAAALKRSGFEIIIATDLDKAGMEDAIIKFARATRSADVAMFYYSGHALQFEGINYLMPVDAQLNDEADLRRMVRLDGVVADMQQAKSLRILVLDSCRDNPLADQLKRSIGAARSASIGRGLAKIDSPEGMIVAYATQAGRTADDGDGRNSPYTAAFLKNVEAKEEIGTIFRRISAEVYQATHQAQLPELSLSLIGEFYLNGKLQITATPATTPAPVDPCAAASDHWKSTEAINTKPAYEDHLARFPTCSFASLARTRIASLSMPDAAKDGGRFDGIWLGTLVCEPTKSGLPGWKTELTGRVTDGVFHAEFGRVGKPGSQTFDGTIEPDGTADILQKGWSGNRDPFHRPLGTEFNNKYLTKFDGPTEVAPDLTVLLAT
ncbi:Caspase domain-containing protein [Bradyrhizobium lablabi]|uniref:Caspase domain-containing protein n=1 Tax=Bradyrhizobium lablabi TaxID=722472 RepID=A0A1M7BTA7_9BRAD|nr:caspase family protein [Bradyrhizobium lablabi]SHL58221.1 Caspase domain-containing protein [Bradyrhizobium lablabi]